MKKLNLLFISLILLLIGINYRIWENGFWPVHDSLRSFQYFYTFYNEFFWNGELTRWFPYGTYGLQADDTQLFHITPSYYFWILIGSFFRIHHALLLFKISILFELFVLLIGTYLLASEYFKRKITIFFVTFGVIASTVWIDKYIWNFRVGYLIPFIFYFLTLFLKTKCPHYMWLCGVASTCALIGNLPYYAPLYLFTILVFLILWALSEGEIPVFFEKSRVYFISFLIFFAIAAVYLYFVAHMFDHMESQLVGREAGKSSSIESFLNYEGRTGFARLLALIYPIQTDTFTLYIGFLPLLFALYALLEVRKREFAVFGFTTLLLFAFSFGDDSFIARSSYHLIPGMNFFRYVGHIGALQRFFLLVCAGFGLEHFLGESERKASNASRALFYSALFLVGVSSFLFWKGPISTDLVQKWNPIWSQFLILALLNFVICLSVVLNGTHSVKTIVTSIVVFFLIDLLSYQNMVMAEIPKHPEFNKEAGMVKQLEFQSERLFDASLNGREKSAFEVADSGSDPYSIATYNFAGFDTCASKHWTAHWSKYFNSLFRARGGVTPETSKTARTFGGNLHQFLSEIGCEAPKLRLMGNVKIADGEKTAYQLVKDSNNLNEELIVYGVPEEVRSNWKPVSSNQNLGEFRVSSFSMNSLTAEVNVVNPRGAWFYYLDNYHPGWRAKVNEMPAPIATANLGFKAIFLEEGIHRVEFDYFDGMRGFASHLLAFFGLFFCFFALYFVPKLLFENEDKKNN